jgi:Tfp pilus assembly protein PilW
MKNKGGYTLIETMFGLAILLFLVFALFGIYLQFGKLYSLGQSSASSVDKSRLALNGLVVYTAQAKSLVASRSISGTTYTTNTSTLVLKLPSTDAGGSVIEGVHDYVVYTTTSSLLYRIIDPGTGSARVSSTKILSSSLFSLTFAFNNSPIVSSSVITASVVARSTDTSITTTSTASESIILRNYE